MAGDIADDIATDGRMDLGTRTLLCAPLPLDSSVLCHLTAMLTHLSFFLTPTRYLCNSIVVHRSTPRLTSPAHPSDLATAFAPSLPFPSALSMSLSEKVTKAPAGDGSKKPAAAAANAVVEDTNLDLLEEDDEFEEFPAESPPTRLPAVPVAIARATQHLEIGCCAPIMQDVCRTLARKQDACGSNCDSSATSPAVLCCAALFLCLLFVQRGRAWTRTPRTCSCGATIGTTMMRTMMISQIS